MNINRNKKKVLSKSFFKEAKTKFIYMYYTKSPSGRKCLISSFRQSKTLHLAENVRNQG